jgi:hypothetical protein
MFNPGRHKHRNNHDTKSFKSREPVKIGLV